jgi:hypothetical protein
MEDEIEQECRDDTREYSEDDISESEYPRADLHPFAESTKDAADDWGAM